MPCNVKSNGQKSLCCRVFFYYLFIYLFIYLCFHFLEHPLEPKLYG